jgi:hypothetical protein
MSAPRTERIRVVCPQCGSDDVGTFERLIGVALVAGYWPEAGGHGEFAYTGEIKVDWDSSTTAMEDGQPVLECRTCLTQFRFDPVTHQTAICEEPHVVQVVDARAIASTRGERVLERRAERHRRSADCVAHGWAGLTWRG